MDMKRYMNLFFHIHVGGLKKEEEVVIQMEIVIRKEMK
jgi:hypothetical protein